MLPHCKSINAGITMLVISARSGSLSNRNNLLKYLAAAVASATLSTSDDDTKNNGRPLTRNTGTNSGTEARLSGHTNYFLFPKNYLWKGLTPVICACESNSNPKPSAKESESAKPLSRLKLLLYKSNVLPHSCLPVPRSLTPSDPVFEYPEFRKGLRQRKKDELRLNKVLASKELQEARASQNQEKLHSILDQMHKLLYGEGITPQVREDFLIRNGCTGFTPENLEYLVNLGEGRGFVEIGAGNGQWARALTDCHVGYCERNAYQSANKNERKFEFVQAFDNMKELPLSPKIYHNRTQPAHRYFYPNVRQCDSHIDVVQGFASRGRILLLVFPPPSPMAIEAIRAYANAHKENDTIVYVGEGKGGANGSNELFDYLLGKTNDGVEWVLLKVMDVNICPGGKGYEKMFVFRRVQ